MKVQHSIKVKYESTNCHLKAQEFINTIPNLFAADFETAIKYSKEEVLNAKLLMHSNELTRREQVAYQAIANATALGHPSHCTITHCSMAFKEDEGFVFIIDNQKIADVVLDFLTTTEKTQVWHNYSYDGRFLRYYQGTDAKNIEDTQLLAKTLLNHVETHKAKTSLKELAGQWYGDWAIDSSNFGIDHQYEDKVIKYAATDACATFKLWHYMQDFIKNSKLEN